MATNDTAFTGRQRRSFSWLGPGLVLYVYGAALVILLGGGADLDTFVSAKQLQPRSDLAYQNDTGICQSMDIRNTLDTFRRLEGCRVVEGFVQILLFDNVNETELSLIRFPELTEITDYLLLYRVNGLRSVGQLFPNLSVIRGRVLFFNYALVVFEMSSLQELGLYSLTDVTRGLVRIDKNPSLCFVNSINWDLINHEKGEHFIKNLKPANECPICPGGEKTKEGDPVALSCPKASNKGYSENVDRDRFLCWNRQHCQKVCPSNCHTCNSKGVCCNENCLGGCSDDDINACKVCRNLAMGFGPNRQCMSHCPDKYYEYLGRRCVKYEECIKMRKPIDPHTKNDDEFPYKIFQKSCIDICPANYMGDGRQHKCVPCEGRCRKECPGVNVDSINLMRQLRGCTHITGSLEIQIRGGRNAVNELEENLSMIEEIYGYLKVVRSFPLVSLNFLKSLKRIRGNHLESQKYAFVVLDNQNLQDLWDWNKHNRTLHIDNGRLFFHFNPKLCLNKIIMLQEKANLSSFTELEVAANSNGDKIACDVQDLAVEVTISSDLGSKGVILTWKPFEVEDQRKLLGYIVYLIETKKDENVTVYDGRDACGGDGWHVDDVQTSDEGGNQITHPLVSLHPYTRYAYYVKTYTIANERRGAQSKIDYFRTLPAEPSQPLSLQVNSNSSDSLTFIWKSPIHPNGNVTHYIVSGKKRLQEPTGDLENNNYCSDASSPGKSPQVPNPPVAPPMSTSTGNDTCPCDENKSSTTSINESEEASRIKFEDDLQNEVYVKKGQESRRKRDTSNKPFPNGDLNQKPNTHNVELKNLTENSTDIWESFNFKVYGKTEFYLTKLHHFTYYDIYVQACREHEGEEDKANVCSATTRQTAKTGRKEGANNIYHVQITNQSAEMVSITWKEPEDPNGNLLTYSIEYKQLDNENSKPTLECITHQHFINQSRIHTLKRLYPGNYSLRVFATSSGGNGEFSPYTYFYIEQSSTDTTLIVLVSLAIITCLTVTAFFYYKKRSTDRDNMRLIPSVNPEYVPSLYVPDDWEVPRKNIDLIRELGQGSFGMVYEGSARDIRGRAHIKCAVKTVNEHATNRERLEFLNEASVMKAFDTSHVVRLLGVVSQGQPTLVIMELMANGDLKYYLRSHRPDAEVFDPATRQPPSLKQILQMAIEIADGMAYLAAMKFVHRDLAARNCMVAEDLTVKIGDFGMTRDIYETDYYRKGTKGLLPVRWMAPESLKDGVFTSNSDVWSYGVVLWEMATLASQPYQGLSNDQVLRYVIDGGVMERPENCPDKLYTLMRLCWQHKPSGRPSFLKLCSLLLDDASKTFTQVSFYHSAAGLEARATRPTPSPSQDDPSTPLRMVSDLLDHHFSLNSDDSDDDFGNGTETHITFPSISIDPKDLTTANGYVSGGPTNGAATTQC